MRGCNKQHDYMQLVLSTTICPFQSVESSNFITKFIPKNKHNFAKHCCHWQILTQIHKRMLKMVYFAQHSNNMLH